MKLGEKKTQKEVEGAWVVAVLTLLLVPLGLYFWFLQTVPSTEGHFWNIFFLPSMLLWYFFLGDWSSRAIETYDARFERYAAFKMMENIGKNKHEEV